MRWAAQSSSPTKVSCKRDRGTPMQQLLTLCLNMAIKQQGLLPLYKRLEKIVPDISHQYNSDGMDDEYWFVKLRGEHAFQVRLALEAMEQFDVHSLMDIGDSAGTHIIYLTTLSGREIRAKSLNNDPEAIKHIKRMGLEAIEADAQDYDWSKEDWDMFLAFDMLEHLTDPISFLVNLRRARSKVLVITAPYVRRSRVHQPSKNEHINELSPGDWKFLFATTGWEVVKERHYLQFPHIFGWGALAEFWERNDFLGFWGCVLKKDS